MADQERLRRLLGKSLPVRVIPAWIPARRAGKPNVALPEAHNSFRHLQIDETHEEWLDWVHIPDVLNKTLLHEHEDGGSYHIVVSSASRKALEAHLDSASIWTKAIPRTTTGPSPIFVANVVAEAVFHLTGLTVAEHLAKPRDDPHVNYHDLLGADLAAVRDDAIAALDSGLRDLEHTGVIHAEDRAVIHPDWVIDMMLRAKAKAEALATGPGLRDHGGLAAWLQAHPGSIMTRFGPAPQGEDLAFSIRDIGSIELGNRKAYFWPSTTKALVQETVEVTKGNVDLLIEHRNIPYEGILDVRGITKLYRSEKLSVSESCVMILFARTDSTVTLHGTWTGQYDSFHQER